MKFKPDIIKKPSRPTLIVFFLSLAVGFLLTGQFFSTDKVNEITDPDAQKNEALEVSILAENNENLREEVADLEGKQREYDEVLQYRLESSDVLQASLDQYKDASGLGKVFGQGVTVTIDGTILDVHLLDLLNNLRNIGVKGVAINGQRLIYKSRILPDGLQIKVDGVVVTPPYRFDAVGDANLLANSLQREGGLLEQLSVTFPDVKVDVAKKDNLELPAYRGEIQFKYAEVVD